MKSLTNLSFHILLKQITAFDLIIISSKMQELLQRHAVVSVCVFLFLLVYGNVMYGVTRNNLILVPVTSLPITKNITSDEVIYISIKSRGRLGNQMFEYAALRGIAKRNRRTPVINHHGFGLLFAPFDLNIKEYNGTLHNATDIIQYKDNNTLMSLMVNDLPKKNISLVGYYQSYYFFDNIAEDIRHDFAFKSHIKKKASNILYKARPIDWGNVSFIQVGIHVRRTDLITKPQHEHGFIFAKMFDAFCLI